MAFGTKLLYFAGYTTDHRPRPLVLDQRVREALQTIAPGTVPAMGTVREADYLRYLDLAERWAAGPTWAQQPDDVEYAGYIWSFLRLLRRNGVTGSRRLRWRSGCVRAWLTSINPS